MDVTAQPPLGMLAELTHRCPLHCPYCSNPIELITRDNELTTDQWLDVLSQARELGVLQVHMSGGEPLARNDLPVLVKHAADLGCYVNLVTSGLGLTEDEEGQEIPSPEAAIAAALDGIRSMLSSGVREGELNLHGSLEVVDEAGRLLRMVPFSEAVEVTGEPRMRSAGG